jgi:hypothetical protein
MLGDFLRVLRTGAPPFFTLDMAQRDLALLERAERAMAEHANPNVGWARDAAPRSGPVEHGALR